MASNKNKRRVRDQKTERRPRLVEPGWKDRMFVRKNITLNSPEAKDLANFIIPVSIACCRIGLTLQRYAEDIRVLSLLESVDEEIFKTLGKELQAEIDKLNLLATEQGIKRKAQFPNPVKVDVDITHPYGLEYTKIVENLDNLILLLGDLFQERVINDVQYNQTIRKWWSNIRDANFRLLKLSKDTLTQAQQEKAQQDQKEAGAAKGDETTVAPVSALPGSQSPGPLEPTSPETSETLETGPGNNGRRPRRGAKTGPSAPVTEEDQDKGLGVSGPLEPPGPEETVAAVHQ